ncbi:MAG: hypothetical protein M1832_005289 [Thelocarpon impressellum]|nr:MAG: hypothetical protein M1832_005289 [Thelocarpon impressellum]
MRRWANATTTTVPAAGGLGLLYYLVASLSPGGIGDYAYSNLTSAVSNSDSRNASPPPPRPQQSSNQPQSPPVPPEDGKVIEPSKHYFNGYIKFYQLASSLQALTKVNGHELQNQNVLFAAANLKSAALLIPIACEMARWQRNDVHLAFMGRDDLPMLDILAVNGVDKECDVTWHDARADFAPYSSDNRLLVSVAGAMYHINEFMHPQAVIIDGSGQEDAPFLEALREKLDAMSRPLIELPDEAAESMNWITRLDSGSLSAWDKTNVDILIHAPSESSGSLIKLLQSLEKADFFVSATPRLTIELPPLIDPPTQRYLDEFRWPPGTREGRQSVDQLMLRHRIPYHAMSEEEASVRFLESFYPRTTTGSHMLVLSPRVELSPLFFHYLKYAVLEYKYSSYTSSAAKDMFGISLDIPMSHLNDSAAFSPPTLPKAVPTEGGPAEPKQGTPFLWQAPNSDAALYFGDKWIEFHDFLGDRLEAQRAQRPAKREKLVSRQRPSWMEYLLELFQARGYYMLYPHFDGSGGVAIVHNELAQPPIEFATEPAKGDQDTPSYVPGPGAYILSSDKAEAVLASASSLGHILPSDGDLPEVSAMPALSHDGGKTSVSVLEWKAAEYAATFKSEIGGCTEGHQRKRRRPGKAGDLFCLRDDDDDDDEAAEVEPEIRTAPQPSRAKGAPSQEATSETTTSTLKTSPVPTADLVGVAAGPAPSPSPSSFSTFSSSTARPTPPSSPSSFSTFSSSTARPTPPASPSIVSSAPA